MRLRFRIVCTCALLWGVMLAFNMTAGAGEETAPATDKPAVTESAESADKATDAKTDADPKAKTKKSTAISGQELIEKLKAGGNIVIILAALSIFAAAFFFERLFRLRQNVIAPDGLATQAMTLWSQGKLDEIKSLCDKDESTLSSIIRTFVNHRHCSSLELSTVAGDIAARDMRMHKQKAYPLAVVATLSPLLGLLGTVIGMIESFETVAVAGAIGDASILADGISKALITTAVGLVVAVPCLGAYHYFRSRTTQYTVLLEEDVNELIMSWFLSDKSQPAPAAVTIANSEGGVSHES